MKTKISNWLYKKWWKYMAVIFLMYVLIGGLLIPLSPGLVNVSPISFKEGEKVDFTLMGYNTMFTDSSTSVFLRYKGKYYCVNDVKVKNKELLNFNFAFLGKQDRNVVFDIIVNNNQDGTVALRDALTLKDSIGIEDSVSNTSSCEPSVKKNLYTGFAFPYREILYESIRNTYFHVPMWFGMLAVLILSLVYSIRYLSTGKIADDWIASESVNVALLSGALGIFTGMVWANFTWGSPWPNDPKLNGAAVGVLIYIAYIVLRGAINDTQKRARISAVYNVFAMVIYILFIFVIPRITDSLHPGNGGNPAFSKYDLDSHMRMFFYPAVIGWSLLFIWLISLRVRIQKLQYDKENLYD
jgi:heme exporter protein C